MVRRPFASLLPAIAVLALATEAEASFHLWDIKEVYSNADGSVQYIELFTTFSGQSFVHDRTIVATSDGVARTFTFAGNLSSDTASRHLLIATPGFAALPGAVTPDYVLPCGPFFDPLAASITIDFPVADTVTFSGASLPIDGTNSLTDTTVGGAVATLVSGPSSPTNFAGGAGAMGLTGCLQLGTCEPCDDGYFRRRLCVGFEENPTRRLIALVLRRLGGEYSLMGRARRDDNSQADTGFFPLTDGPHFVELDWTRSGGPDARDGSFQPWIDGVSMITLTGLDNSRSAVDFARMGALSVKSGSAGTLYWDEFASRRESYIGP